MTFINSFNTKLQKQSTPRSITATVQRSQDSRLISPRFSYFHDHKMAAMATISHDNSKREGKAELFPHF